MFIKNFPINPTGIVLLMFILLILHSCITKKRAINFKEPFPALNSVQFV